MSDHYDPSQPARPSTPSPTPVPEPAPDALGPLVLHHANVDPMRLSGYVNKGEPFIFFRLPNFPDDPRSGIEDRLKDDLPAKGITWKRVRWYLPGLFIIFEKSEDGKLAARTYFSMCDWKFNLRDGEEHALEIYDADLVPGLLIEKED